MAVLIKKLLLSSRGQLPELEGVCEDIDVRGRSRSVIFKAPDKITDTLPEGRSR
jgi:hypothetical protein